MSASPNVIHDHVVTKIRFGMNAWAVASP